MAYRNGLPLLILMLFTGLQALSGAPTNPETIEAFQDRTSGSEGQSERNLRFDSIRRLTGEV